MTAPAAVSRIDAVRVLEAAERLLERGALLQVGQRHVDRRDLLGEQAAERRRAGHVELRDHALLGLAQLVRAVAAQRAQVVAAEVEPIRLEQPLGALVRQLVPLELEEEQLGLDRGAQLARLLHEGAAGGIGGVEREVEHRVRGRAAADVVDLGQLAHRLGELVRVELAEPAAVALGEGGGAVARLGEELLDAVGARGRRRAARGPRWRIRGRGRSRCSLLRG